MPDVEPLRFPSREGQPQQASQDQAALQAGRRQTCALLNSPSPCVNNALYHIKELKMTVESWCQQSGKYQTQINQERKQNSKTLRYQSIDSDSESVTSTALFVEGIAISARESCPLSPLLKKINDVNGEVVYLIEHLEADRQYAEEALRRETRRKRFLENKVDCISLWKQEEHSVVVQKEHEACIRDITELKWLLRLEREKLDLAQEKLSQIELRSQRLNEDINFANKQVPIVRENMVLQSIAIEQLNAEQAETDASYANEKANLARVQRELKKMEMDNKNEKKSREKTLIEMKNMLVNRLEDLNPLKKTEEGLHAEIENFEKVIAFTEERCADMKRRIPEMMELVENERDQILQLNHQMEEEMLRNRKLKQKLIALQEDMEKSRLRGEADVSCMEEQLDSKRNAFVTLRTENLEFEQDVENYKIEISESEKAVKQMREERKQMLQKIIDNDEQWEKAKEELTQVAAQHKIAQTELEEQEHSAVREEEKCRKEIETMRKDLTGQMTTLELLKGQCAFANDELLRFQSSSDSANQKLQKEFEEASSAKQSLETKIEKIKKLIENYEEIQLEHMKTYSNLEKEKELRCCQLKAAKDIQTATKMSYDNTLSRIDDLTKMCNEYKEGSDKMDKIVESLPEVIAEFQSVHDVVEFKNKSAALIMSTLQSDINNCQQRAQRSMQTHSAHVTARREAMENTKESLIIALKDNKRLASDYEGLKKTLMEAKQVTVSALRDKNHAHKTFHCYTQLSLLQKRMHKALVKYFKQRSLYSQAELDRCHVLSQHTDQKIKTSQDGMSEEILLISAFLQSLTDDSTTTDDAGVNKQASPDAAGSNE